MYCMQVEVMALSCLNIAYIPRLIYSGYTLDGKWCVIMEYFTGGTLDYHIKNDIKLIEQNKEPKMEPKHKKYIAYHLVRAIEALHGKTVILGYV